MPEQSEVSQESHHHHHHSHSSPHDERSRKRHRRHRRHREHRGADAIYEMNKSKAEEIATNNVGQLRDTARRLTIILVVVGVAAAGALFILEWNHYDHTALLRSSVIAVVFLGLWLFGVRLFHAHKTAVFNLYELISFQQSRIESLKGSSFKLEKDLEKATQKLRELGADTAAGSPGGEGADYRKLSGLS